MVGFAHAGGEAAGNPDAWARLAQQCAATLGPRGTAGTLGVVYATEALADDLSSLVTFLRQRTGVPHWVGAVGPGVCATGTEYFDRPGVAVMTLELAPEDFCVLPGTNNGLPAAVDAWADRAKPRFGLVHGNPRSDDTLAALETTAADGERFLVGGLTSDVARAQVADDVSDGALSGVLFAGDTAVVTGLTQSCLPIGPMHMVTAARENVVETLDGAKAVDVLTADVETGMAQEGVFEGTVQAGIGVAGSDTNDYMVRNLVGIDPDNGQLAVGAEMAVGDRLMFVRRDREAALVDLQRMLDDVRRRADGEIKGALYHSCVARGPHLFGDGSVEAQLIQQTLGDVPMVGFFGNGEFSHNRLYGYTGVLTVFL